MKGQSMIRRRGASALLAVLFVLTGCAQTEEPDSSEETPSPAPSPVLTPLSSGEQAEFHGSEDVSGESEVELEVDDYYFGPTVLRGKAGQELTLSLTNEGAELHNLTLQDQSIDTDISAGQSEVKVKVKFPAAGSLTFFCEYHLDTGMRGELTTV